MPVISPRLLHFKHTVKAAEIRDNKKGCHTCNTSKKGQGLSSLEVLVSGIIRSCVLEGWAPPPQKQNTHKDLPWQCKRKAAKDGKRLQKSATSSEYLYHISLRS